LAVPYIDKKVAKEEIGRLVEKYNKVLRENRVSKYNEEMTKKFTPTKVWKRIFEKTLVCPQCGSSKHIIIILDKDQYGDIECLKCDVLVGHYTKKEMKELGYDS